jgi:hypothetical protein
LLAQMCSKVAASSQAPWHRWHSSIAVSPTCTSVIFPRQPGHGTCRPVAAARERRAPHAWQCTAPSNIKAKHDGQLTVASVARQYWQAAWPGAAGPPQLGQRSAPASDVMARR